MSDQRAAAMVERVARAIQAVRGPQENWDRVGERTRELWRNDARAAIAAMDEPTPATVRAPAPKREGADRKTEFYWASVAGADPEPVEVCGRACYTLGCADPFFLDDPDCPVRLAEARHTGVGGAETLHVLHFADVKPMSRPGWPRAVDTKFIREVDRQPLPKAGHGWRGPR